MEVFKIKISPEVIKNELVSYTYESNTFGYYSGLSNVLTAGTVSLGNWNIGPPESIGNLISFGFEPIEGENPIIWINKSGSTGYDWSFYLKNVRTGSTVTFVTESGYKVDYKITQTTQETPNFLYLFLELVGDGITIPVGSQVQLIITQPGTSQLIDLSIPVLLKQEYEDLGYYSPFDGEISQLNEDVNFTFTFSDINPYEVTIYNTSDTKKTFLKQSTYTIDWGDSTPIQEVTVFIPETISHTYLNLPDTNTYTITFSGVTSAGNYVITKTFDVPYYNEPTINNPYGNVVFQTGGGSWSSTPHSQDYINYYDSLNTVESQASYNYVSVPFIVSGYTNSRLQELKVYGASPYINDLNINLKDGTNGKIISQSPEYTAYTINGQNYLDFPDGKSVFVVQSFGFTEEMLVASAITKMEYLMNVIEQPEIQSSVFIERGKNSGMENFRRIGEIGNTGSLENYGYKFFDVRNYNDI